MSKNAHADITLRIAEMQKLITRLGKLRLSAGPAQCKEAEDLAAKIQEQAGLIRTKIRDMMNPD
jgi:hypothetical protein